MEEKGLFTVHKYIKEKRCILYNNNSPTNKVNKDLTLYDNVDTYFLRETNVLTPVIEIEYKVFISANYCFLPIFNRYYFIKSVEIVNECFMRLYLTVDVLMSFKEEIMQFEVQFKSEVLSLNDYNTEYNSYNINGYSYSNEKQIDYYDVTLRNQFSYLSQAGKLNICLDVTPNVQTILEGLPLIEGREISDALPNIDPVTAGANTFSFKYALDGNELYEISKQVFKNQQESYIRSITVYPFNIESDRSVIQEVSVGDYSTGIEAVVSRNQYGGFIEVYDFTIPSPYASTKFINYEPYTTIELFLPYYGYFKIDISYFKNTWSGRVVLGYSLASGKGLYYIISKDDETNAVYTVPINIGFQIGISYDNQQNIRANELRMEQVERQADQSVVMAVIQGVAAIGAGITGNFIPAIGFTIGAGASAMNAYTTIQSTSALEAANIPSAYSKSSSGDSAPLNNNNYAMRITTRKNNSTDKVVVSSFKAGVLNDLLKDDVMTTLNFSKKDNLTTALLDEVKEIDSILSSGFIK